MIPVTVNAPTMDTHTSVRSTVMNLKRDVGLTGFLITGTSKGLKPSADTVSRT